MYIFPPNYLANLSFMNLFSFNWKLFCIADVLSGNKLFLNELHRISIAFSSCERLSKFISTSNFSVYIQLPFYK